METREVEEGAGGHYRTAGLALVACGAAGAGMTGMLASVREGMLGYIDTPAAVVISAIVMVTGGALLLESGRLPNRGR